jgi:hypothetical protein
MKETFRLSKKIKRQGIAFTAIFLAVLVAYSSIFFLDEPAKHGFKGKNSVAVVGGMGIAVFGGMLLLSIYMWRAYYVERFSVDRTMLTVRSMLQNRQFDVSELKRLKWSVYPAGGSIVFRVLGSRARLDLHGYDKSDRLQIIRVLRDLVPHDVQEGWPLFCHKVALPLRDGKPSIVRTEPSVKLVTVTRGRYDRLFRLSLPLSVVLALVLWGWLGLWQFFALPILMIGTWLLLRFNVPPHGHPDLQLTSTSQGRAQLVGWGAVAASQCLMVGLALLGVEKSVACAVASVVLLTAFAPLLYFLFKADKQRRATDEQAAASAPLCWQQGETATRAILDKLKEC